MIALQDRRLDDEPWPHVFEVPAGRADAWIEYLQAECDVRGWQLVSVGQMEAEENSGSITIRTQNGPESPEVIVVWERRRHGPLAVRARPAGQPALSPDEAAAFLVRVNDNFHAGVTNRFYERAYLYYEGLPWRGELWLGNDLRLGPPSRHADALFAPQIIVIDAVLYAPSWRGARAQFDSKVRELGIFLSVVMHTSVGVPHDQEVWTTTLGGTRPQLGRIGYFEESALTDLPPQGQNPSVPLRPVTRPDFGQQGLTANDHEQWLPADVFDLWHAYKELSHEKREQFQRAGALYKLACGLWHESATTSLALLVVACEALKPEGRKSKTVNVYGVVESLLGTDHARRLER